ncbi:hypothetical protein SAMN04488128_105305 [Chitinophaga eiseniae]|uniref:Uncharacterized protein n=1 Tax=Chitinophaga eiseniae TaxID=634771 RepID=A0A1T4TKE3_9BACT|nr:hypothetical protein [Chitinophaga eiseniae]SKA40953.1 hypothetical protein SAMN04488128_105305 [Chitinophaga eiseniae]
MQHIPENIKVAARFILLALQRSLADHATQRQLHQGLTILTYHLPAVLHNAGLTKTLIPASHIHCQLQNNLLGVDVPEVGTFLLDIQHASMITFTRPPEETRHTAADSRDRYPLGAPAGAGHPAARYTRPGTAKTDNVATDPLRTFRYTPPVANLPRRFDPRPRENTGQPHQYFIYLHTEDIHTNDIDLHQTGVVRINPKD